MLTHIKYYTALLTLLVICSCSKKDLNTISELDSYQLVVISHTNDGKLLDYMVFNDLSDIRMIRINPKIGHKNINVTLFGSKRNEALKIDAAVISEDKAGFKGCVEVSIQNGIAIGSMGNGAHMPSPITNTTITEVSNAISAGRLESATPRPFEILRISEQTKSTKSNQ